jgi:hypothetical protein
MAALPPPPPSANGRLLGAARLDPTDGPPPAPTGRGHKRTARQLLLDSMREVEDFMPEVCRLVEERRGRWMHVYPATVRRGRTVTTTTSPWPDLTIWFPERPVPSDTAIHLVELKAYKGKLSEDQAREFATLEAAGAPVHTWWPRDLDRLIPETLTVWAGRPGRS